MVEMMNQSIIISAGYHICSAPEEVQCRSVLYPGLPMSEMGQTVTCNKDVGFICNNKQQGPTQQCFDYEIRLKCCGCQTPSTTGLTTPSTPSTTVTTITTSTPSTTVTTTTPSTPSYSNTTTPSTPSTTVTTTTHPQLLPLHNNYNTLNAFHHSKNYNTLNSFHYSKNYNTLNSFHYSNNYNTLNSFHHSNNYNTLNAFHHITTTTPSTTSTTNNYNTLNSFHYSNNYNTLNAFHHSNNYNTLNSFHYSNNYNTLNAFHHSKNYNTLNAFHHSKNYNTLNYFNHSTNYDTSTTSTTVTTATPSTPSTTVTASTPLSTTTTTPSTTTETTTPQPITTGPCPGPNGGDDDSIHNIISAGYHICSAPEEVQCRSVLYPGLPMSEMGQTVTCNKDVGFICNNKQQGPTQHNNYNTLNSFHYSNNYNTLNAFHHNNNYNTLNSFHHSNNTKPSTPSTTVTTTTPSTPSTTVTTTTPSTPSTTVTTTTHPQLLPPHNNYNTLNSFHHSNNYNTLTPSTTVTTTTPSTTSYSNNYNTLNSFHHSNNYNTLNSFHHSNNYNTLNAFHHSNNYNTLNSFHHSNNYNTLNSFHHSNNNTPSTPSTTIIVVTEETTQPITSPQHCHCFYNVYNETDYGGYCYIGYCNDSCHVVTIGQPCFPYPPYPPPVCYTLQGPKQNGESWIVNDCTNATCINGNVIPFPVACPTQKPVFCANNFAAIKVLDDDGCCSHYECICFGWGDPHYVTFDGTYYGFQGNCSYWLVKEISPKYNFSVMIDNYYCGAADGLSCPQSITVFYKSYTIFIIKKEINSTFKNQISVNDRHVSSAYQNGDFRITTTGIDTVLVIPKIHAKITFSGLIFSIDLPYSKFGNNTWGQCGTCDNNRTDDCMLPSGKIDSSCPNMAHEWHTNDSNCKQPPPTPNTTPTPVTCNTSICEIIKSSVFEACHKVVDYLPFVEACEFDVCHMHINHIGCISLQTYAEVCALAGICIDWRSSTKGLCGMQPDDVIRAL
ncbi:hypothetical protein F7725_025897 [Dissostichus mawsoni]|uniref:VWFD domain-containing protein n=1 Tax=Dissostichus mawsoni TaxID=36200 RepID=A0A7J5X5K3_DISMA|nr:hypothetical protein F7725_025897 [Dissostichus mawsoni]